MGIPILVIGKSGSGKSFSLRNMQEDKYGLINVMGKMLPFKGNKKFVRTFNYDELKKTLLTWATHKTHRVDTIVIDDAGYLLTNALMTASASKVSGNNIFGYYREMAENFYELINFVTFQLPEDVIVPIIMHEDVDEFGFIKPKTVGRMLDEKADIPGMFTIVLRAVKSSAGHQFQTKTDGMTVVKTPHGMFGEDTIPNDMEFVVRRVREFYALGEKEEKAEDGTEQVQDLVKNKKNKGE